MANVSMNAITQWFNDLNKKLNDFIQFVGNKLKNFKNLSQGEQVSYVAVAFGIILILVSIVLFII